MSFRDYLIGQHIGLHYTDDDFYAIMQGAMRLADSDNLEKLKVAFPDVWTELQERYNAPGGRLETD